MDITHEEKQILQLLDQLKEEWIELQNLPQRQHFITHSKQWEGEWKRLQDEQRERKVHRDSIRSTLSPQDDAIRQQLTHQSQHDSLERRQFKHQRDQLLASLSAIVDSANQRIPAIQQERKALSRKLSELHQTLPLRPLSNPFTILYEDAQLLAINKPAGLLSVPGRTADRQESVQRYLQHQHLREYNTRNQNTSEFRIRAIHRLDQDTSGILLFAKDAKTLQNLQQQFALRQVHKTYEAILEHNWNAASSTERDSIFDSNQIYSSGTIDLPLWGNPDQRPYQQVNHEHGKYAITQFQVLAQVHPMPSGTRIQLTPLTGRTHQLRVHAAAPNGLNNPILGDRLYGTQHSNRLYLHATSCVITHQGQPLRIVSPAPF